MTASPALSALRRATAAAHSALEDQAGIEARLADPAARPQMVAAFHRFHVALETEAHPLVAALGGPFTPQPRAEILTADLAELGMTLDRPATRLEPPSSTGVALGWVYVAEGSMLGGRVIRRRLIAAGSDLRGLSFLDPYGDQTGERWRAFLTLLEQACADGTATIEQVVQGGGEAFAFADAILRPVHVGAAA